MIGMRNLITITTQVLPRMHSEPEIRTDDKRKDLPHDVLSELTAIICGLESAYSTEQLAQMQESFALSLGRFSPRDYSIANIWSRFREAYQAAERTVGLEGKTALEDPLADYVERIHPEWSHRREGI